MRSMTGYGSAKQSLEGINLQIEIKTVNGRFLDMRLYVPRDLNFFEYELRKRITARIQRGSMEVRINFSDSREPALVLNSTKLKKYYEIVSSAVKELGLTDTVPIEYLLNEPGVIQNEMNLDEDTLLKKLLQDTLERAIDAHILCAEKEGANIKEVLLESMNLIKANLSELESTLEPYKIQLFENLKNRISELLAHFKVDTQEQRLVQELALYIDKFDVHEELSRLYSHIETFMNTIKKTSAADIGKTLNFILQEMQRESNTLGSKYSTSDSFKYILVIKEEIEKSREIVQNVC